MRTVTLTPHFLYFLWDVDDQLLYIGITDNPTRRFAEHQKTQHWWHEVAYWTHEILDSKPLAEMAEREAIANMHPKYNKRDKVLRPNLRAAKAVKWSSTSPLSWRWTRDARWALFFIKARIKFNFVEHIVDGQPICGVFILKARNQAPHLFIAANSPKDSNELDDIALAQYRATFKMILSQIPDELQPQSCIVAISTHNSFEPPAMYAWRTPLSLIDLPFRCHLHDSTVEGMFVRADGSTSSDSDPRPCEWRWNPDGSAVFSKGHWTVLDHDGDNAFNAAFDAARVSLKPADPPEVRPYVWADVMERCAKTWDAERQPLEHWLDYDKIEAEDSQADDAEFEDFC